MIISRYVLRDSEEMKCPTTFVYDLSVASLFGTVSDNSGPIHSSE